MKKTFFLVSFATILTAGSVTFAQETATPVAAPAVTAEEEAQQTLLYKVVCNSNAELVQDQELVNQVGADEQIANIRSSFQSFAKDPIVFISNKIAEYEAMKAQALQIVTEQITAADLQAQAEVYATANSVSVEEAKTAILDQAADAAIAQFTGQPMSRNSVIVNSAMRSCSLIDYLQPKITATGCKTTEGAALDMTAVNGVCQSISKPMAVLMETSGQIGTIQQESQMAIQLLTQTIQKGMAAQIAPLVETMQAPQSEIINTITSLISATPAPVAVPAAP